MSSQRTTQGPADHPVPAGETLRPSSGRRTVTPVAGGAEHTIAGHRFMLPVVREIAPGSGGDRPGA
jgi:hypothetical protein